MGVITDQKYAESQGLTVEQVRKIVRRLDVSFLSIGKGPSLVYLFDPEELEKALSEQKRTKRARRRRPRSQDSGEAQD